MIAGATISVATVGDAGSSKSWRTSLTNVECQGCRTPHPASAAPAAAPGGITRYFGRGAFDGIRKAVAATPRSCALSDNDLTALVMAPIFKEVSMAETPDAVPSPMTLSRWDEWTGIRSGSSNLDANYGLYAFRDPSTPYVRAYWNPGVGIFQYDPAGVGAPFTAAEMAGRYCAAGGGAGQRRAAAWQPWGALGGIAKSEALFQEMLGAVSRRSPASAWSTASTAPGGWPSGSASSAAGR